ncbi:hypothetical protein A6R68_22649, partial [Neotoma lepida]
MGVEIHHSKDRKVWHKEPKSQDIYLYLLVKLYRWLDRRTNSTVNQVVLKTLIMSHTNHPVKKKKTAVVVGMVTDDMQILQVPKLKAKGNILTFGQLAWSPPGAMASCSSKRGRMGSQHQEEAEGQLFAKLPITASKLAA